MQIEKVADLPHLSNRYELLEVMKSDGFWITVSAIDLVLKKNVTIKTVHKSAVLTDLEIRKFENQARSAAKLSHSQIEAVLDFGLSDKIPYLVTEQIEGESLRQFVERKHPISLEDAMDLFCELVQIVEYMHDQKVIHNNLSLDTVLVGKSANSNSVEQELKVIGLDFAGFSQASCKSSQSEIEAWQDGSARPDKYNDIRALGEIFEQCLIGPNNKGTPVANAYRDKEGKDVVSRRLGYGIMEKIIENCSANENGRRYQSAFSLRKELKEAKARLYTWDTTPGFDKPATVDKKSPLDKLNLIKEKTGFGDDSTFIFVNAAVLLAIAAIVLYYLFARVF